jgi:large subunit ribosomal protein L32
MAVPKKRHSKSKKNSRLAKWTSNANLQAKRDLSLAKSIMTGRSTSFISNTTDDENPNNT